MTASYPDSIFEPRTISNLPGLVYDPENPTTLFAEDLQAAWDEIVAIETLLGVQDDPGFIHFGPLTLDLVNNRVGINDVSPEYTVSALSTTTSDRAYQYSSTLNSSSALDTVTFQVLASHSPSVVSEEQFAFVSSILVDADSEAIDTVSSVVARGVTPTFADLDIGLWAGFYAKNPTLPDTVPDVLTGLYIEEQDGGTDNFSILAFNPAVFPTVYGSRVVSDDLILRSNDSGTPGIVYVGDQTGERVVLGDLAADATVGIKVAKNWVNDTANASAIQFYPIMDSTAQGTKAIALGGQVLNGANTTNMVGWAGLIQMGNSARTSGTWAVTNMNAYQLRLDTLASLDATITNARTLHIPAGVNSGGQTITNYIGIDLPSSDYGATNHFGIRLSQASGSGRYNLYAQGTAPNYFAGNVGIGGLPTTTSKLNIQSLPTSSLGLATGDVWNNSGTLRIA